MKRNYLKKTDLVMVNRHQKSEMNDTLNNQWVETPVADTDWSTDSGTMIVTVEFCPNGERRHDKHEYGHSVQRDESGRAYYESI